MSAVREAPVITAGEKKGWKHHDQIVRKFAELSLDAGRSWKAIRERSLWKIGNIRHGNPTAGWSAGKHGVTLGNIKAYVAAKTRQPTSFTEVQA